MGEANRNLSLIVRVGAQVYALSLTEVVEVMRALPVSPLVGAPDCVRGLSLIRGSPSPVVDFGKLLTNEKQTQSTRFVTVRAGQRTVALAVNAVVGICELAPALQRDLPACQFARLVNHLPAPAWLSVCPECQYSSASRPLTDQGSSKYRRHCRLGSDKSRYNHSKPSDLYHRQLYLYRQVFKYGNGSLVPKDGRDWALEQFDVIFCGNVMSPQAAQIAVSRLARVLAKAPFLLLNAAETLRLVYEMALPRILLVLS